MWWIVLQLEPGFWGSSYINLWKMQKGVMIRPFKQNEGLVITKWLYCLIQSRLSDVWRWIPQTLNCIYGSFSPEPAWSSWKWNKRKFTVNSCSQSLILYSPFEPLYILPIYSYLLIVFHLIDLSLVMMC